VGREARTEARRLGGALAARIWEPWGPALGAARELLIVPDGPLHFVPFAALPEGTGSFLLESAPPIRYLGAERDLASDAERSRIDSPGEAVRLLALGAPEPLPAAWTFPPIAGAEAELREVTNLWRLNGAPADLRLGGGATERELVERGERAGVLHLATHAFFAIEEAGGARRLDGEPGPGHAPGDLGALARIGLVLAPSRETVGSGTSLALADGLLSGEEIAALDLSGVRLAVVAACDSGAGTPARVEGVLGLRRGLTVAGAASQVLALFPVEDEATRHFMGELHRGLLGGDSPAAAVRRAGLARLAAARAAGVADDIRSWGAFVALGPGAGRAVLPRERAASRPAASGDRAGRVAGGGRLGASPETRRPG
jgi:CHAT domain-containing protein